jgi:hypothetical protein
MFGQIDNDEFFPRLPFLFLLGFGICVEPLKIQLCPPVCICFEFSHYSFDLIIMLLEVFFFNFIPQHLISFNFCIQSGSHSFDCYFFIFCIFFLFCPLGFYFILFCFQFWSSFFYCFFNLFLYLFYFSI